MNGPTPSPSTRRDLFSAYVATAARIGSWVIVAGVVMRRMGADEFALLALVRGTLSILNYGTLGLGPAMIHHLSRGAAGAPRQAIPAIPVDTPEGTSAPVASIAYANPIELADPLREALRPLRETYAAGLRIAVWAGLASAVLLILYARNFERLHEVRYSLTGRNLHTFVIMMGLGAIFRLVSDAPAAVLQVRDRITADNSYQCIAEGVWVVGVLWSLYTWPTMWDVSLWFMISGAFLFVARLASAATVTQQDVFSLVKPAPGLTRALLTAGGVIVLGQLANYLYAPAAMILINRLLEPELVAYYEAAVQIDAALLLLVTALATVLLPKAAVAHAADDRDAVRRYYVRGTLASLAMLTLGAVVAYALSPWIFPLWLGEEMRTTRAILPTLLVATVVGGSAMVGRSILLAMGKVTPFTVAALVAGVCNVVLGFVLVKLGWGLRGIVTATALVVIARAGIWQPWYVMRALRLVPSPGTQGEGEGGGVLRIPVRSGKRER